MEEIKTVAREIAIFLEENLPSLGDNWWATHVIDSLTFQQQRIVTEKGIKSLKGLDLAALLRVLDRNWFELSSKCNLAREGRNWIKESQSVRNKWAHLSTEATPPSESYRDLDTLWRLMDLVDASEGAKELLAAHRDAALEQMKSREVALPGSIKAPQEHEHSSALNPSPNPAAFSPGDMVVLRAEPDRVMAVISVHLDGAEPKYTVFADGKTSTLYESQLAQPEEVSGFSGISSCADVRSSITSAHVLSPSASNLLSVGSGRVNFVPYQYRPVLKLINSDRPRILIADEVGVGKTIEAGLILKELRARLDIQSVLVVCPKALVAERKWFNEMKRFDESFFSLDGKSFRHCLAEVDLEGEWPDNYSKAILPFSLFDSDLVFGGDGRGKRRKKRDGLLDLNPPPQFDLVIVDEAHHLRNSDTFLHQGVKFLCDHAKAVVLMTATPVQLGSDDLFTLLNIVRPDLIIDQASFGQMAEPNPHINAAVQHCRSAESEWAGLAKAELDAAANTDWGAKFLRESPDFQSVYDRLLDDEIVEEDRVVLTRDIEELYTFSSIINRTRRRDIGEFTTRKPETIEVPFSNAQRELHDRLLFIIARILERTHGSQNVKFMMTTIRRQAASCLYGLAPQLSDMLNHRIDALEILEANDDARDVDLGFLEGVRSEIGEIITLAEDLDPHDEKAAAFLQAIVEKSEMEKNKALVFSTFRHTLSYLSTKLSETSVRFGLVHGNVPDEERAELRRRFSLPKEDSDAIDVLLSSEVGCEGLDFQFCDLLVNYDIPWNPMKVEQRIGRVDRYGQESEAVAILNFITPGTVDADIYQRCLWRIGVFQSAVGGNEEILGQITRELHSIADSFDLTADERAERLQQIADNGIRKIREERDLEEKQAQLFGLNLPGKAWNDVVEGVTTTWLSDTALEHCVRQYLARRLNSDGTRLSKQKTLKTLRLDESSRGYLLQDYKRLPKSTGAETRVWEKWLRGHQNSLQLTFDQETAVANPGAVHCTLTHPLVRQAASYLGFSEPTQCSLEIVYNSILAGRYRFALYRWSRKGIRPDEEIVAVADDPTIESSLLNLIAASSDSHDPSEATDEEQQALDTAHYEKWSRARAEHIAENEEFAEHRMQSLVASHHARTSVIKDQIARTSNDKILRMKESELARAEADFERSKVDIKAAAKSGDIVAELVLYGIIEVKSASQIGES
ncbi:hypothetical protein NBRC116589_13760 [Ruegeria sp. HU-ET01832]|uniref:helicase-related protein n=1 Tax=Ruegeria sp. HU-ET01832 TaxID=3135906 RepID=UPI00310538EB